MASSRVLLRGYRAATWSSDRPQRVVCRGIALVKRSRWERSWTMYRAATGGQGAVTATVGSRCAAAVPLSSRCAAVAVSSRQRTDGGFDSALRLSITPPLSAGWRMAVGFREETTFCAAVRVPAPFSLLHATSYSTASQSFVIQQSSVMDRLEEERPVSPLAAPFADSTLMVVDGKALLYRAYYRVLSAVQNGRMTGDNDDDGWTSVVFSFLSLLLNLLDMEPTHVAVVFDAAGLTFRHELYPKYKSNRNPTPDPVEEAIKVVKPALAAMGLSITEMSGVEADDVIATIAVRADAAGFKVLIASPDKDFFQILSQRITLLRPDRRGPGVVPYHLSDFGERFGGLCPLQFVDVLALMGDSTDSIPGVKGIGQKGAIKLVRQYGSLEQILEKVDSVARPTVRAALLRDSEMARLSKRLALLQKDLHICESQKWEEFLLKPPLDEGEKLRKLLNALGGLSTDPPLEEIMSRIDLRFAQMLMPRAEE